MPMMPPSFGHHAHNYALNGDGTQSRWATAAAASEVNYNLNWLPLPQRPGPTARMPRFYNPYLAHVMLQSFGQHARKYAP